MAGNQFKGMTHDDIKEAVKSALSETPTIPQEVATRLNAIEVLSERLSKVLLGNGSPEHGLVMKVDRSTNEIATIKEEMKTRANREWGIWAAIIISIASSILQLVIQSPK